MLLADSILLAEFIIKKKKKSKYRFIRKALNNHYTSKNIVIPNLCITFNLKQLFVEHGT